MVYKSDTVQTSFGIDTVNYLYIRLFQPSGKIFFRADVLHGFDDFLPCPFCEVVLLHLFSGSGKFLLQYFITERLAELAGFKRGAYLLSVIIQSSVHDAVIFFTVHTSSDFINGYVIQVQKGVILCKRMAVVAFQQCTDGMLYLRFHVTFRIIHFLQVYRFSLAMFSECGMKPVLYFHFAADVLCPDGLPVVVYLFSFLVDTHGNDVHVFAVDVFVQPYDIRLVPVTELFHELLSQKDHLFFRKYVFRGRI